MRTKPGPTLVVDALVTLQLVRMPEFWAAAPAGLFDDLRIDAEAAGDKAVRVASGQECAGCTSVRAAIGPTHDALWARIAAGDAGWAFEFLAAKRGYRPAAVEVYYRGEGGASRKFTF